MYTKRFCKKIKSSTVYDQIYSKIPNVQQYKIKTNYTQSSISIRVNIQHYFSKFTNLNLPSIKRSIEKADMVLFLLALKRSVSSTGFDIIV